ncbi:glutamic acid-rich protein-like, partial [Lethenteron reissneri]|uniref:glutamic acid-rich protein-like n=1 Tax=Lethenteron reissneri TaxID=7753 RepID=UPI002AB6D533
MDRQITWAEILDEYEARESACQSTTWGDVMDKVDPFPGQSYKNRSPKRIIGELKDVSGMKHLQEKNLSKERCTMEEERLLSFGEEGFQAEKMDKKTEVEQEEEKVEEEVEEEQEEGMEKTENGEKM